MNKYHSVVVSLILFSSLAGAEKPTFNRWNSAPAVLRDFIPHQSRSIYYTFLKKLITSSDRESIESFESFLQLCRQLNQTAVPGTCSLNFAIQCQRADMVRLMLDYKANPLTKCKYCLRVPLEEARYQVEEHNKIDYDSKQAIKAREILRILLAQVNKDVLNLLTPEQARPLDLSA